MADSEKVAFAREQRSMPTRSEGILWRALRRQQLGVRFRRQHPIGDFVLDFYCGEAQIAIEVDGPTHAAQADYDAARDAWLRSQAITVLRFPEEQVREDLPEVLSVIREALGELS